MKNNELETPDDQKYFNCCHNNSTDTKLAEPQDPSQKPQDPPTPLFIDLKLSPPQQNNPPQYKNLDDFLPIKISSL